MKPSEALAALKENEARYANEVETGTRKSGTPLKPEEIERRKESLKRVVRSIEILQKWMQFPPRRDAFLTPEEQNLISAWITPDEDFLFSGVADA